MNERKQRPLSVVEIAGLEGCLRAGVIKIARSTSCG